MKKIILVVIVALVAVGFALLSNLDGTVKTIIETAGTKALGTPVHVGGLNISLANKTASMNSLAVANLPGFKTDNLLKAKLISVTIGDVVNKTVTIKEIIVDGLTITYELGPHGANFDALRKNLKSAPSESNGSSGQSSGFDVIIQQIKITHAQVIPAIGGRGAPVTLPDIILNNIGSKNNPATPGQIAAQVMNHVLAVSSGVALKSGLAAPVGTAVNQAKSALKGLLSNQ